MCGLADNLVLVLIGYSLNQKLDQGINEDFELFSLETQEYSKMTKLQKVGRVYSGKSYIGASIYGVVTDGNKR